MRKICCFVIAFFLMLPGVRAGAMADSAASACLMNAITGEIVFEKDADTRRPMASTTKIMTLLVAIEKSDPDDLVTVANEAVLEEGSSAYIESGAKIKMKDLWYGLMLNSGNDAAVAIAYHISGGKEAFAEEMNAAAKKIGANNTSFKNPNGLDAEGHYTTAKDLALITQYALTKELFAEIVSTKQYTAVYTRPDGTERSVEYINHNRLLREFEGCIGVKTGYTKADGRCLVSAAKRDGAAYIAVTLNDPNDWNDHREMLELGFNDSRIVRAVKKGDCIRHVVSGKESGKFIAADDFDVPVNGKKGGELDVKVDITDDLYLPFNKGEKVGTLDIYRGENFIGSVDIIADSDMNYEGRAKTKRCFGFWFVTLIRNLLR